VALRVSPRAAALPSLEGILLRDLLAPVRAMLLVVLVAWLAPLAIAQSASSAGSAPVPLPELPTAAAVALPGEPIENPYGLKALWQQGDPVARGTLLLLLVMSMGSWYVIVTKFAEQSRMGRQARSVDADFWAGGSVQQAVAALAADSPFRYIAEKALEGAGKHEGLLGAIDFNTWVTMAIQRAMARVQSRLQSGLAVLATVGSTAPFVGLFGTVWGIYHALVSIGLSGQASIDKVAGPVGEALIMTALGLAVAVPAVLGYNWLVRRNKAVMDEVQAFGGDLHAVMLATQQR
jgi:biopolymer transport protein ExbB